MKKSIAIILCVVFFVTCFAGCGAKSVEGTWECQLDVSEFMIQTATAAIGEEAVQDLKNKGFSDLFVTVRTTYNEDGTYITEIDKASLEAMMDKMIDKLAETLLETERKEMEELGFGDEVFEKLGLTKEKTVAMLKESINEENNNMVLEANKKQGVYKVEDGKIYKAETTDALEGAGYESYELSADTLTITGVEGIDTEATIITDIYPQTYTKVK